MSCSFSVVFADNKQQEKPYAEYINEKTWGGTYGTFGVTEKWNGLDVIYDGWYVKALAPDYISVKMNIKNLLKSIAGNSGYFQEGIFDFAFIDRQCTAPQGWDRPYPGIYMMTRNIDGNLYVQITVHKASDDSVVVIYENVLDIKIGEFNGITLKGSDGGTELYFNQTKIECDGLLSLNKSEYSDENGYTYFCMKSYSAGGTGTDENKRLLSLSYIAEYDGQVPDPSVVAPDKPITGEEDYDAEAGMGLTAKKYAGKVTQGYKSVIIDRDTVLYTPVLADYLQLDLSVKAGSTIRVGLDGDQKVLAMADSISVAVYLKNDGVVKASADGNEYKAVGTGDDVRVTFGIKNDSYEINVNGVAFSLPKSKKDVIGDFGTFVKYSAQDGEVVVKGMYNPAVGIDLKELTNWNSPFGGVVETDGETIVFAHATVNVPLNNKYVRFDFKINGLLDTLYADAMLSFALLAKNGINDPVYEALSGIYVAFRIYNEDVQFRINLQTEFMGKIVIADWTDIGISSADKIRLIFLNENDGYRIIINNYEYVGEKMCEIITSDASDRDDRCYFAIGCIHDTTVVNENVYEERSLIAYTLDNVLDDGDIPEELIEIGKAEDPPVGGDDREDPDTPKKKHGCGSARITFAWIVAVMPVAFVLTNKRKG